MLTKRIGCVALAAVLMAGTVLSTAASAQSLRNADQPAEFPPASFTAKQYVDSKGCVYIRAGIDGNTTWVPRVSRSRTHVCGQTPSLGNTRVAAAAPQPQPNVPVIQIEPEVPVVAPEPAPAPAAAPAPKPRVVAQPAPKRVVAPAPKPRVVAQPKVVKQPAVVTQAQPQMSAAAVASACPGASLVSQRYLGSGRYAVRCGPQAGGHQAPLQAPVTVQSTHHKTPAQKLTYGANVPAASAQIKSVNQIGIRSKRHAAAHGLKPATNVHPRALVVPKHVYAENVAEQQHTLRTPHGYRPAWEDDRLNQRRAYGTLAGKAQMELVWTRTTPRRLIDKKSKQDVTHMFPTLYYPFTSQAQLDAARLAMAQGKKVKVRVKHADVHVSTKSTPRQVQPVRKAKPAAVKTPRVAKAASHRFVQVGTFGDPNNARNAIRRLQSMGLPVKVGKLKKRGRVLEVVLAGPFRTQNGLNGAMNAARKAGFRDSIFRK